MLSREATTLPSFRVEINSQDKGNELRNRAAMGGIGRGSKGNFSQRLPPLSLSSSAISLEAHSTH